VNQPPRFQRVAAFCFTLWLFEIARVFVCFDHVCQPHRRRESPRHVNGCGCHPNRGNVTEMLLNLLKRISRKIQAGLSTYIAGAKLMGWLGNAWGGHFYLSW